MVAIVGIASTYGGIIWYWQRHFEITPISVSEENHAKAAQIKHDLDETLAGMKAGEIPWRKIDYSSVGFPGKEAELLELRREVDGFNLKFGRLPISPSELLELLKAVPSARRYREKDFRRFARDCQMVLLGADSYILNCDGWQPGDRTDLERLVATFQPHTERFYLVGKNLVLFVPPFVKGRPLVVPEVPPSKKK